jgi:protein-S-isoprenylcysteine O-methyltransferase Ste14
MFAFRTIVWGTLFMALALVAGPWIAVKFDGSFPPLDLGLIRAIGIPLMLAGVPLTVYCAIAVLTPGASRPAPYDAGGSFTVAGPYLFVRNPFMLGILLTLWGEALLMSRISMFAYALIISWAVHFWVIFYEEPSLEQGLGDDYRRYRRAVPRWFPKVRKYRGTLPH